MRGSPGATGSWPADGSLARTRASTGV